MIFVSKSNLSLLHFSNGLLKFCKSEFHSSTDAVCPCVLNFVVFSIRECLVPKHLFVCWLWGKEDMINEYS